MHDVFLQGEEISKFIQWSFARSGYSYSGIYHDFPKKVPTLV